MQRLVDARPDRRRARRHPAAPARSARCPAAAEWSTLLTVLNACHRLSSRRRFGVRLTPRRAAAAAATRPRRANATTRRAHPMRVQQAAESRSRRRARSCQCAVQPPSIGNATPVMEAAALAAQEHDGAGDLLDRDETLGRLLGQEHLADHLVTADAVRLRLRRRPASPPAASRHSRGTPRCRSRHVRPPPAPPPWSGRRCHASPRRRRT